MDTKEQANEERGRRKKGSGVPFGSFQNMSEMMNNCCGDSDTSFDCRSMMARMMGSERGREKAQEQATQTGSEEGQKG